MNSELIELEKTIKSEEIKNQLENEQEIEISQNSKRIKLDLWGFVQEQQDEQILSDAEVELDRYLREPVIKSKILTEQIDIYDWWQLNKHRYPHLYKLTLKYLSIPATSVPSERVFSKAGEIKSDLRSRIKADNLNSIIFFGTQF